MVELVGKIQNVRSANDKNGRPYIFVNFADYRTNGVKLNIWNNAIKNGGTLPNESWVGKWVTIKGLVEPPYTSPKAMATHIAITANALSQITRITEDEAKYRLGEAIQNFTTEPTNGSNADLLKNLMGVPPRTMAKPINSISTQSKPTTIIATSSPTTTIGIAMQSAVKRKTPNQIALESLRNSGTKLTSLSNSSLNIHPSQPRSTPTNYPSPPSIQNTERSNPIKYWGFFLFICVIIYFMRKLI